MMGACNFTSQISPQAVLIIGHEYDTLSAIVTSGGRLDGAYPKKTLYRQTAVWKL
jgi:hypothetical protein